MNKRLDVLLEALFEYRSIATFQADFMIMNQADALVKLFHES